MKLVLVDRLTLNAVLPQKGNIVDSVLIQNLREQLMLSAGEIEKYGVRQEGSRIIFDDDVDLEKNKKEIAVSPGQKNIICKELLVLNDAGNLTSAHIEIYEIFVGIPKDPELQVLELPARTVTDKKK